MARESFIQRFMPVPKRRQSPLSFMRSLVTGSFYKFSSLKSNSSLADIKTQIDTMRALAKDAQISTCLSYYATDATVPNSKGQIIWASPIDKEHERVSEIVNCLFDRWRVSLYARDHILELATIGNLYIPTTLMYAEEGKRISTRRHVVLDNNTIPDPEYDIIPSYKIPPEEIVHLWKQGVPKGFIHQPEDGSYTMNILPEAAVIHFSLGGLLGDYTLSVTDSEGNPDEYDIQFADPLLEDATGPTQTLNLLEDAMLLSSLAKTIKFLNVDCGSEEEEIQSALQMVKDSIEQQLSLDTNAGDAQSFINPQSPNNLIYLPKVNGNDAISVTDLNMSDGTEAENALLEHFQDKKLSVLGVPKEALNFSSAEGLGGAGAVLSQRSALYANALSRLETAYKEGWRTAINTYFTVRNMSGFVDQYVLNMSPIITAMSGVLDEKKDSAMSQAQAFIDLLKNLGIKDKKNFLEGIKEILSEAFPNISSDALGWKVDLDEGGEEGGV